MANSATFSAPFLSSSIPPGTKIIYPRISFRVKTKDIGNQYNLYSRTSEYVSSMIEIVDFAVSYAPVSGIISLRVIITIAYEEVLIISPL